MQDVLACNLVVDEGFQPAARWGDIHLNAQRLDDRLTIAGEGDCRRPRHAESLKCRHRPLRYRRGPSCRQPVRRLDLNRDLPQPVTFSSRTSFQSRKESDMTDRTTKALLLMIAVGLWVNLAAGWLRSVPLRAADADSTVIMRDVHAIATGTCMNKKVC